MRWDILTGEYPPQPGGVSAYTHQVAAALAETGDEVHVWSSARHSLPPAVDGLVVHRLPGNFGSAARRTLAAGLRTPQPRVILVQYVPQAFGHHGANLPFCVWLWSRRNRENIWTLFHEVQVPFLRDRLKSNALAVVTRIMAALVARASRRVFITIPAWKPLIQRSARSQPEWLPVPSNLPIKLDPEKVREVRASLMLAPGNVVIGHFSSYSKLIEPLLYRWLAELLAAADDRIALLVGNGVSAYGREFSRLHPALAGRLRIAEGIPSNDVALHLAACDLLVQPYPDGASTRRSTLMASLALGMPILTNDGHLSEAFWRESGAVLVVDDDQAGAVAKAANRLLGNPEVSAALRARAAALYRERFSLELLIAKLRAGPESEISRAAS